MRGLLLHSIAGTGGLLLTFILQRYPLGDAVAPVGTFLVALALAIALLVLQQSVQAAAPVTVLLVVGALSLSISAAPGSSLAAITWYPVIIAVVLFSALSPAFLLVVAAVTAIDFSGALVLLQHLALGSQTSGSVPYFLGFVGVVGVVYWTALAIRIWGLGLIARFLSGGAVLVASLCLWMVLASGARAAVFGLGVAALAGVLREAFFGRGRRIRLVPRGLVLLTVLLAVPIWDAGLTTYFTAGSAYSTVLPTLDRRAEATRLELGRSVGSFTTRLQFWRQAAVALGLRPQGHGLGSYGHVIHNYQDEPMLWSASPHNFVALAAVETGVFGVALLLVVIGAAASRSIRRDGASFIALIGAAVVMSLDIFGSQPVQSLIWWAVLGSSLAAGNSGRPAGHATLIRTNQLVTIGLMMVAVAAIGRLELPCTDGCDPIARFAGYPRNLTAILTELDAKPYDGRWDQWENLYPISFWLVKARADALMRIGTTDGYVSLIQRYPNQSIENYLVLAENMRPTESSFVAQCGLANFFAGQTIWRDHRSSVAELQAAKDRLTYLAGGNGAIVLAPCEQVAGLSRPK